MCFTGIWRWRMSTSPTIPWRTPTHSTPTQRGKYSPANKNAYSNETRVRWSPLPRQRRWRLASVATSSGTDAGIARQLMSHQQQAAAFLEACSKKVIHFILATINGICRWPGKKHVIVHRMFYKSYALFVTHESSSSFTTMGTDSKFPERGTKGYHLHKQSALASWGHKQQVLRLYLRFRIFYLCCDER